MYVDSASAHSISLPSADPEKVLFGSQSGSEPFEPRDYSATITAGEVGTFLAGDVPSGGPDSSGSELELVVTEATTEEDKENLTGWLVYSNDGV